jgi:hypothetical protein
MLNSNTDIFEISYEESVSHIKQLENLEKNRRTNGPGPGPGPGSGPGRLPLGDENTISNSSIVGKSSKNSKSSNMWCHNCHKNNHKMTD